jgi:hypothetical protein
MTIVGITSCQFNKGNQSHKQEGGVYSRIISYDKDGKRKDETGCTCIYGLGKKIQRKFH